MTHGACLTTIFLVTSALTANGFVVQERTNIGAIQRPQEWYQAKNSWKLQHLSKEATRKISNNVSLQRLRESILPYLLYPRTPGSPGSANARRIITTIMEDILGWRVDYDTFVDSPPFPYKQTIFSNIIATHNQNARRRLVLACHYDSKVTPRGFVGATDSAVPCSMMMEVAVSLRGYLENSKGETDLTLQLIFFDGEEAFVEWSNSDSLYGSRHLARLWQNTQWPENDTVSRRNKLDSIDLLALLDLLGAANPKFYNSYLVKSQHFEDLIRIEKTLFGRNAYFQEALRRNYVEDDHIPFYRRNVSVLHVIPHPFPRQWHTLRDTAINLDGTTMKKLTDIFAVFVAEYLHLKVV